ncbi:MAG TPA: spore coat protein [Bacillota bacterium]|nr:spore coat protein [Bacillota bacterium]
MYTDREMTLDALEVIKTGSVAFTQAATEVSNPNLRQTILQMRNQCEQVQQQLGQLAQSNNYYMPAPPAPTQDIAKITQFLVQSVHQPSMV